MFFEKEKESGLLKALLVFLSKVPTKRMNLLMT